MKLYLPSATDQELLETLDVDQLMGDARWQPLVDVLQELVILVDRAGIVRYFNRAAEAAVEVLRSEVVDSPLQEFVAKSALELTFAMDAFLKGTKTGEVSCCSRSGHRYSMMARTIRSWQDTSAGFLITGQLISDSARSAGSVSRTSLNGGSVEGHADSPGRSGEFVVCEKTAELVERGLRTLQLGSRLLLVGESGVGKTELARHLHQRSGSPLRPFVHVNCGSIPETLFESEMFGYERGSFTGALAKGKRGLVEAADNGVLFLDEVGEIPLPLQAKMLQFVEDGGVQRVGGTQMRRLRVQVISATNRDLAKMVAEGSFRKDLYYRLGVVTLRLPPLRDCPNLVDELIDRTCDDVGRRRGSPLKLDRACRQMLRLHTFPGNVRELQNVIEHLAVVCGATVRQDDVKGAIDRGPEPDLGGPAFVADSGEALRVAVRRYEGRLILDAIARTGSKRKAAEMLGVDVATVIRKSRRAEN